MSECCPKCASPFKVGDFPFPFDGGLCGHEFHGATVTHQPTNEADAWMRFLRDNSLPNDLRVPEVAAAHAAWLSRGYFGTVIGSDMDALRRALVFYANAAHDGFAKAIQADPHPYSAKERHERTLETVLRESKAKPK